MPISPVLIGFAIVLCWGAMARSLWRISALPLWLRGGLVVLSAVLIISMWLLLRPI